MSLPAEAVAAVKKYLLLNKDLLLAQSVERIVVQYDGCGDEGQVHDIHCEPGSTFEFSRDVFALFAALEPEDHYGDNEGGGGTITCNVKDQSIHHESYNYITECRYAEPEVL